MIQRFRSAVSLLLIVSLVIVQSGCSFLAPRTQHLNVSASEPDAQIFINGEFAGDGNVQKRVRRNKDVSIMVKKDGYETSTRNVGTTVSAVGMLDLMAGYLILLPLLGILAPGFKKLNKDNVSIVIHPLT